MDDTYMAARTVVTLEDLQAKRDRIWAAQNAIDAVFGDVDSGMTERDWRTASNMLTRAEKRIQAKIDAHLDR